ncbi:MULTISPECIES: GyrI-like domain-containing protein [Bacillus]|uniref:GyrI-like domain-containing protein n=1 Tax=Bacillus TaxID=1386 RepID=UPI000415B300|nr:MULTISPECIES: GyrI-like domain-containing protein [Bacillus]QHZ48614.1 GyrI-like domain-containing protein [Bacillus sp. NSP9.1]WFA05750.1 GyrI-like domain-containing protein [Bacillus sp. HSf4]
MDIKKIEKCGFTGVGFTQTVTFKEARAKKLHGIIRRLRNRYGEISGIREDRGMWAISNHQGGEGFTFYILMETDGRADTLPEGMISFQVPPQTYAHTWHPRHELPEATYQKAYQWVRDQGYEVNTEAFTHMEFYPMNQDLNEPEFDIYIPVTSEKTH